MFDNIEAVAAAVFLAVAVVAVGTCVLAFIHNMKLFRYMKNNRHERWIYLSTLGPMGPGVSNPFRWFPFLFGDADNDDPLILHRKKKVRVLLFWSAVFFGFLLIAPIILIIVL